jgi:hypothetical protein
MMNDYGEDTTSIKQDVVAAITEYLWLAKNEDYAPAKFAMATIHYLLNRYTG